jgi:hypothetical protein
MRDFWSRRRFLYASSAAGLLALPLGAGARQARAQDASSSGQELWPEFPRQNPARVRETVGASHRDEQRVRDLVGRHPALVNATWDWGFGDWETALGAAAHTGRRNIALFLIEKGARLDIFAAAMLGLTDAVKAFVAAQPGIQRTPGPHGIPLLAHAQAGGAQAAETLAYLESLGDAGQTPALQPLTPETREGYVGRYRFGAAETDVLEISVNKDRLEILRPGNTPLRMHHLGEHSFYPAGAVAVRLRFEVQSGRAESLAVVDHDLLVTARRV